MLHMAFKLLGGPVIGKVVEAGTRWFEKRAEIAEAKHTARLEIESKKATADIDWTRSWRGPARTLGKTSC